MKESKNETKDNDDEGAGASPLMLHHLGFEYRVAIWALRMNLHGGAHAKRVRAEFDRVLPAAASRIAFTSIQGIIDAVRTYGKQSLKFNCICNKAIAGDEQLMLSLFVSIDRRDISKIEETTRCLVEPEGVHNLLGAATGFLFAIKTRKQEAPKTAPRSAEPIEGIGSTTVH